MTQEAEIGWQGAVAALTAERGRAVAAAGLIQRLGGESDKATTELTYGEGKAEADAVVSSLVVALEQGKGASDLASLETRLAKVVAARQALAERAWALVGDQAGEKGVLVDLLSDALPYLLTAVGALWTQIAARDALTRKTIATQLEAARWPLFAEIEPR